MPDVSVTVTTGDRTFPATLSLPVGSTRGGLIPLHPASDPSHDQFLFRHLAATLPQHGIAVLRFDRRPRIDGKDVPLAAQAGDALAALGVLRAHLPSRGLPFGLWGFSQGAWAAPLAAALSPEVAFLVLVASTGVSPAVQMRYGTAEQVRRAGFGPDALVELAALREAYEHYLRGKGDQTRLQATVDQAAQQPWFPLAYIPRVLPAPRTWEDMDFDPVPIFARVHCPVLLFYGEDDEWTPVDASIDAWQRAVGERPTADVTVVRLAGTRHHPTFHGRDEIDAISPEYSARLVAWLTQRM